MEATALSQKQKNTGNQEALATSQAVRQRARRCGRASAKTERESKKQHLPATLFIAKLQLQS